jgi:6-phosphogluconolactonase (cycloisomerase 2 family)
VVNQGSKVVAHFAIASNGVLTSKDTVTTSATPVSVAVNAAGTYLYVVTQSAQLIVYPLSSGAIGTAAAPVTLALPSFAGDTIIPTGVTVLPDSAAVYVSVYDQTAYNPGCTPVAPAITCTPSTANPGWVIGYAVGSGGALTAVPNSPFKAGIKPSSLLADPTGRFMYVTDFASNQVIGYTIGTGGTLNFLLNGPFRTGNEPNALVVEPRGKFLYIANALSNTVTADTIDLATGTPNGSVSAVNSSSTATDTEPVAIAADPALGRFIYTANYLGNTLSGFRIDPDTGTLTTTQATPYPTGNNPTALVIVPHGNHATQVLSQ